MTDPFDTLIEPLLGREGGYSNNPADTGGPTNWGITERVARAEGYPGSMQAMTRDTAKLIYRRRYWTAPGFDKVAALSVPLAEELFDTGVNMGVGTAARWLQRALNVLNRGGKDYADLTPDGQVGQATLDALASLQKARGALGFTVLLKALNCLQGAHYIELAEQNPSQEAFAFGWLANRVSVPA